MTLGPRFFSGTMGRISGDGRGSGGVSIDVSTCSSVYIHVYLKTSEIYSVTSGTRTDGSKWTEPETDGKFPCVVSNQS